MLVINTLRGWIEVQKNNKLQGLFWTLKDAIAFIRSQGFEPIFE